MTTRDNFEYLKLYFKAKKEIKSFEQKFQAYIKRIYKDEFLLEHRIKSLKSIKRKQSFAEHNGSKLNLSQIPDLVGYRISVHNESDRNYLANLLFFDGKSWDKRLEPDYVINYFDPPRESGFNAILYRYENFAVNTEVQIMTFEMRKWTNETHGEYEKKYDNLDQDKKIK